jgi:presenilin-like A22 family membrane protease
MAKGNVLTEEEFKARAVYLAPILVSLLFGLACAFVIVITSVPIYAVTPFPETTSGGIGNAAYFVVLVAVGATILYFLLKWKSRKLITFLTGFALTIAFFLVSVIYLSALLGAVPDAFLIILIISIVVTFLGDYAVFKLGGRTADSVVICLGGALGAFFGASIPVYSAVLILAALAIYDVFTVYRGPVGKIANSGLDQLKGLSFNFKEIQMGLGDLVFYSLLVGNMLINFGRIPCLVSIIGILTGSYLTFVMLEKRGVFPGLPFPIILGLAGGLIASLFFH